MSSRKLTKAEEMCALRKSIESSRWIAIDRPRTIHLESDLVKIVPNKRGYGSIEVSEPHHYKNRLPGFEIYRQNPKGLSLAPVRNLAYRCGACHMVVLGSPAIKGGKRKGTLEYDCSICDSILDIFDGKINSAEYMPPPPIGEPEIIS